MYYVYILTNLTQTVLYIGVTNDLARRLQEHREKVHQGFTKKYHTDRLIYYEEIDDRALAIVRETQLKRWKRIWKERLIDEVNPEWQDLSKII